MARLRRVADALIAVGTAAAIFISLTGGGALALGALRVSVRTIERPLLVVFIGLALRAFVAWRESKPADVSRESAQIAFAVVLIVTLGLAAAWQVRACGGLDSYGYVSAAARIAAARLEEPEPLAAALPFESGIRAFCPLGYVVSADGDGTVPRFPLGFPLLMVPFQAIRGSLVFAVPLLAAALTVWIAYRFARERGSWMSGMLAASLVALDPIFFTQAIQPMSDGPATMWIMLAAWLALGKRPRPFASGAAAGMAVLTRPVLLVAIAMIGAATVRRSRDLFARWALAAGAFVAAQAVLQYALFGNPLLSGYGSNEHLFQLSRVPSNAWRYAYWLAVVYAPVLIASIAAAVVGLREMRTPSLFGAAAAIFAGVLAPYLLYIPFDDWEMTRFLLPAASLVLVAAGAGLAALLERRATRGWAPAIAAAIVILVGIRSYDFVTERGVHRLAAAEARYPIIGEWMRDHTPADAIVVSSLYSGSIRYYSGRKTLRWDEIPPGQLAPSIAALTAMGRRCYLSLDGPEEEALFQARFGGELATLREMPAGRVHGRNVMSLEPER